MAKYAYLSPWNKALQCFPLRIVDGYHNLQWMTQHQIEAVTLEYRLDLKHKAQAKEYASSIGATPADY